MKIGIIDYGIGNLGSIHSAFKFYDYDVDLVKTPEKIRDSDILVLAGVGNFPTSISRLKELDLFSLLNEEVIDKKKPILGICLGMQMFAEYSYENGKTRGFGWIEGEVNKIDDQEVKVPHIGWDYVENSDPSLFNRMKYSVYYFMHSYHFMPKNQDNVIGITNYGPVGIVSAIRKDQIVGVQFHPEKSQGDGLRFLTNFVEEFS